MTLIFMICGTDIGEIYATFGTYMVAVFRYGRNSFVMLFDGI